MLDVVPLITLPTFIIVFIVVLMSAALFADIYVSKQEKAREMLADIQRASTSQKAIQRYYNQKGA